MYPLYILIAELRSNITNANVFQRLVCLQVSDLHDERMRTVWFAIDDQLRHDNRMVGGLSK